LYLVIKEKKSQHRNRKRKISEVICARIELPILVVLGLLVAISLLILAPFSQLFNASVVKESELNASATNTGPNSNENNIMCVSNSSAVHKQQVVEYPLTFFRDVSDYPVEDTDVPFLWFIPLSGSTGVRDVMTHCYNLTSAREKDGIESFTVTGLDALREEYITDPRRKYDFFASSHIYEAAQTFHFSDGENNDARNVQGRLIASFRHPHDRLYGLFLHFQNAGEGRYMNETFLEYLQSDDLRESNWMTRFLVNNHKTELSHEDLNLAKYIIRKKCLVLLSENRKESLSHLEKYYGWNDKKQWACSEKMMQQDDELDAVDWLDRNSPEWKELNRLNQLDLLLYAYVRELFVIQGLELDMEPKFGVDLVEQEYNGV